MRKRVRRRKCGNRRIQILRSSFSYQSNIPYRILKLLNLYTGSLRFRFPTIIDIAEHSAHTTGERQRITSHTISHRSVNPHTGEAVGKFIKTKILSQLPAPVLAGSACTAVCKCGDESPPAQNASLIKKTTRTPLSDVR